MVVTGGPGMGKTSIINSLKKRGFETVAECGRDIIQQQIKSGGDKLPWMDRAAFADEMFKQSLADYEKWMNSREPVFFDRGIPDVIGYLKLCQLPVPDLILRAAEVCRYSTKVFITPPWEEIFTQDEERKQSFQEAIETYDVMVEVYSSLGYEIIVIPKTTVSDRSDFILTNYGV